MTNQQLIEKYGEKRALEIIERRKITTKKWMENHPDYGEQYRKANREKYIENATKYQDEHMDEHKEAVNKYHSGMSGRAMNLYTSYRQFDMRKFGEYPDLTRDDIMRICFSENSRCIWCQSSDWKELGLDRISNNYPHSVGNVVCSCNKCNTSRHKRTIGENLERLRMTVEQWMNFNDAVYSDNMVISYGE